MAGVGKITAHTSGPDAFLPGDRQSDRQTESRASGRERLCRQSRGAGDSLPSRDSRRQEHGRISLGIEAEGSAAKERARISLKFEATRISTPTFLTLRLGREYDSDEP